MWNFIIPAAMAGVGYLEGKRKQDQQERWNRAQAEVTRYSPWTGIKGDLSPVTASPLGGAMQGGLTGAMMYQTFNSGPKATTPNNVSDMQKMSASNTPLFESGRYDQMGGHLDATNSRNPGFFDFNSRRVS